VSDNDFVPTDPERISRALGDAVAQRDERALYRVSSSTNLIMLASCRGKLSDLNQLIDALSVVHPGRYFAVYRDEAREDLGVEVSARCYGLSKHEALCSEVIMIGAPRNRLPAVPSVVFAHLLGGNPVELFLCDPCSEPETIELFLPVCERVLLSSSHYLQRPALLKALAARAPLTIDLEWIALSVWRRQTARAFEHPSVSAQHLEEIEIRGDLAGSAQPWLLAGWVADRLQGSLHPLENGRWRIEREGAPGPVLALHDMGGSEIALHEVRFSQGPGRPAVRMKRGNGLETLLEGEGGGLHAGEPLGDESWAGRFRLYFEAGESIAGYTPALEKTLAILRP